MEGLFGAGLDRCFQGSRMHAPTLVGLPRQISREVRSSQRRISLNIGIQRRILDGLICQIADNARDLHIVLSSDHSRFEAVNPNVHSQGLGCLTQNLRSRAGLGCKSGG